MSIARPTTFKERLQDLGDIPAERIRSNPPPGSATLADVTRLRDCEGKLYELIDGTLVEKAMGWQESLLAGVILHWLHTYLDKAQSGVATGADGMTRLFGDTVRGPDVAYFSWDRIPGGQLPREPIPDLVPNFVIEVLSISNTYAEMSRKRREYFHAGVELMWMVHPRERTITVYRDSQNPLVFDEDQTLDGTPVLPEWHINIGELFARLDRHA